MPETNKKSGKTGSARHKPKICIVTVTGADKDFTASKVRILSFIQPL